MIKIAKANIKRLFFITALFFLFIEFRFAAMPTVSIPKGIAALPGKKLVIPIEITGGIGEMISNYVIGLNYSSDILKNPRLDTGGTLSNQPGCMPRIIPETPWTFAFDAWGVTIDQDGTLVKLIFDVSENLKEGKSDISFAEPNIYSSLTTSGFERVAADFVDGYIVPVEQSFTINGIIIVQGDVPGTHVIQACNYSDTICENPVNVWISSNQSEFVLALPKGEYYLRYFSDLNDNQQPDNNEYITIYDRFYIDSDSIYIRFPIFPPTVSITSTVSGVFQEKRLPITVIFSTPVKDFTIEDVQVTNGTISAFLPENGVYESTFYVDVIPLEAGEIVVSVGKGVATDEAGHDNQAAEPFYSYYKPLGISEYDFNEDGNVDGKDAELFISHWLSNCDEPDWDPAYDFIQDCKIDIFDLSYFADQYNYTE